MKPASQKPDGGPAFPGADDCGPGMSLRDWLAGQTLAGIVADTNVRLHESEDRAWVVRTAYELADAMLAARGKAR